MYALSPFRSMADIWLSGSSSAELAFASPGCFWVPRLYTGGHCVLVNEQVGSTHWTVSGPAVVSSTSRPAVIRCFASVGSMMNGLENCGEVSCGSMLIQFLPPSVVTLIAPPVYSSYATFELSGSTAVKKPSPPNTPNCC